MCGIFGAFGRPTEWPAALLEKSLASLSHRGPDASVLRKVYESPALEGHFGHRRLSIIDLSAAANQPFVRRTADGHELSLVFNGEIYNFRALRADLAAKWRFETQSDTEVLMAGLFLEGPSFLKRVNGMFALAFLDSKKRQVLFARDRLGKKPLYFSQEGERLLFASELKALVPLIPRTTVSQEALVLFRWLGYVPGESTIYEQFRKFPAGSYAEVRLDDLSTRMRPELFWDPLAAFGRRYPDTVDAAIDELQALLDDAVKLRLEADVPIGLFLSGGIDSSLVAASLSRTAPDRAFVFTMKAADREFDESAVAIDTAQQLGLKAEVLDLDPTRYGRQIDSIPWHYDEPFSDSSQIPTLALAEVARRKVTVILTGDGGDEAFLGYPRFGLPETFTSFNRRLGPARGLARKVSGTKFGESLLGLASLARGQPRTNLDFKLARIRHILSASSNEEIYDGIMAMGTVEYATKKDELLGGATLWELAKRWYPQYSWEALEGRTQSERFAALDLIVYLRDDVLVKVDRGTMAYAIEARAPLLDYRIVELGCSLPYQYKVKDGELKFLLRRLLERHLKGRVTSLPKRGFGIPMPDVPGMPVGIDRFSAWNQFVERKWRERWHQ